MNSNLRSVAYHEAGHAVAELVFGNNPSIATIEPKGDHLGHSNKIDGDIFSEEGIKEEIIALYAGAEAERLVNDDYELIKEGAWSDDEQAESHLRQITRNESDLRTMETELRKETAELIQTHRELVEGVASELLEHITLNYEELDYIYEIYKGETPEEELEDYRRRRADFNGF